MLQVRRLLNATMLHQTLLLVALALVIKNLVALQVTGNSQQVQQQNNSQQLPSLSERAVGGNGRYLPSSGSTASSATQQNGPQSNQNQDSNSRVYLSHQQQQQGSVNSQTQQQQITTTPSALGDASGPKFNSPQGQALTGVPVMSTTYTFNPLLGQFLPSDLSAGSIQLPGYQQQPAQQLSPFVPQSFGVLAGQQAFSQQPYRYGIASTQLPTNQYVYGGSYGIAGVPQRQSPQSLNQFFRRGGYPTSLGRPVSSFFGQPSAIIDDDSPYFQQAQQQQQLGLITSINGLNLDPTSYGSSIPSNSYLSNQFHHHHHQQQQQQQQLAQQQDLQQQLSQQQGQSYGDQTSAIPSSSSLSSVLLPSASTSFSTAFSGPPPVSSSLASDYKSAEQCVAADNRHGTCYQASECIKRGGTPMGKCSPGSSEFSGSSYVCCLFDVTCGQFAAERFVYFRNPNYPNTYDQSRMCRAKIGKLDKGVCQFRLDLIRFDVAKPTNGNCSNDMFVVSGQNENYVIPKICGLNDGQHYYVGVDESGVITLHMMMMGFYRRSFEIMITQIPCRSDYAAPAHCLQYYMGTHGTIKSFNYEDQQQQQQQYADPLQSSPSDLGFAASSGIATHTAPYGIQFNGQMQQRQLLNSRYSTLYKGAYNSLAGNNAGDQFGGYPNDLDYTMCIRKESGFCSITYQLSRDEQGVQPFAVGYQAYGINNDSSLNAGSNGWNGGVSTECRDDYLLIGGVRLCSGNQQQVVSYGSGANPTSPYDIGGASIQFAHNGTILSSAGIGGSRQSLPIEAQYQLQQLQSQHQFLLQQLAKIQHQQQQAVPSNGSYLNGNNVNNPTSSLVQQTGPINNNLDQQQAAILQQVMLVQQQLASLISSNSGGVNNFISAQSNRYQTDSSIPDYPAAIITDNTPGPFILRFKSNMARNARGFQIDFRQNPCK